jgi:hypothetical protein
LQKTYLSFENADRFLLECNLKRLDSFNAFVTENVVSIPPNDYFECIVKLTEKLLSVKAILLGLE